jgi:hypothetical protein
MSVAAVEQMAERVAALMTEKLGARGPTAPDRIARAARRLPRRLQGDARMLADAARKVRDPRFLAGLDVERVTAAYDRLVRHLSTAPRRTAFSGVGRSIALGLLGVVVLLVAVLTWRGHL